MSDISLWEAMKRIELLKPEWKYDGDLSFETTTADGPVSLSIQKGSSSFSLNITLNGCVIFYGYYRIEYKSGWFGGDEKPHYSREYIYLKEYFEKYEKQHQARLQAEREEQARKKQRRGARKTLRSKKKGIDSLVDKFCHRTLLTSPFQRRLRSESRMFPV